MWAVEYSDKFGLWWQTLDEQLQVSITAYVKLLENYGPNLPYPYSSRILNSKLSNLRELRIQHKGKPYRILYVFDPKRVAVLLLGGNKSISKRWYVQNSIIAEGIYKAHLEMLETEETN